MADFSNYPEKYLLLNAQQSKNLAIVLQIEGVSDLFGISQTFTQVRYGDSGIVYGLPGLVYGGLRSLEAGTTGGVKPYIQLDSSLTIGQRIEPEQGRGNVGTITITLIDKNGEISELIAPGIIVDEIMAKREAKVWIGFRQTSFPEDYLLVYKGYITSIVCPPGVVKLQISDATSKKRQPIFNTPNTSLTAPIGDLDTNIPVVQTSGFHQQILGPDGSYDPVVRTYVKADEEWMEYGATGIFTDHFIVQRGGSHSLGTTPVPHDAGVAVSNGVQLGGNVGGVNAITLCLKLLLSGWNGNCESNVSVLSFVYTYDLTLGFVSNAFVLLTADAKKDLGLTIGDYFTITGATNPANNVTGKITDIKVLGDKSQIIYTNQTFTLENPTSAVAGFRSKYDTLPVSSGIKLRMRDVDVEGFEMIRSQYFTSATTSNMRFFYDAPMAGKDIIDTDILLPIGCYGISRFGRVSMSVTKPPLPGIGKLVELNATNVIEPEKIQVTRATNNRNFWNLISFQYNKNPATGEYAAVDLFLDTVSVNTFDETKKLPISAPGLQSDLGGATIAQSRGKALLNRYKKGALLLELSVNWSVGSLIEVSDIVLLKDEGHLKIMNFETGKRNLGVQLFEVIDRDYNIVSGNVKLKLLGGLGFSVDSRFGLYSPSSLLDTGSTASTIVLKPSFGQPDISSEMAKWVPRYIGQPVQVHSFDWSVSGQSTISKVNDVNSSALDLDPPLGFTPSADYILDIAPYPTSTDKTEQATFKLLYSHFTPSIPVVSGVSGTQFNVSLGDAANMTAGNFVILRNVDFSVVSEEMKISSIVGTLITLETDLGFTPDSTYTVEGVGFKDGQSFYRWG